MVIELIESDHPARLHQRKATHLAKMTQAHCAPSSWASRAAQLLVAMHLIISCLRGVSLANHSVAVRKQMKSVCFMQVRFIARAISIVLRKFSHMPKINFCTRNALRALRILCERHRWIFSAPEESRKALFHGKLTEICVNRKWIDCEHLE